MAYTSLESSMEHFELEGVGYIAYMTFKHWLWARKERKIVLANPVCAVADYQKILTAFIQKYPRVTFVEASKELGLALEAMGYRVNQFGIETELPVMDFELKGKPRAKLRQWRNKCQREGVEVREEAIADCSNLPEVKALSDAWVQSKGGKEYQFLTRPLRYQNEQDVRYFWAYKNDVLVGLAVFDPIYENGEVVAYYHNMDRLNDDAPHGTSAYIILSAIEAFKAEGKRYVSLGMSPIYLQRGMVNELKSYHKFTRQAFWYAFEKLNFLYPFKGNASHKNKFSGIKKPVYFASTTGTGIKELLVLIRVLGLS